ncbi:MAG: 5-formyltetrahydrofolate cyclo-ligase [Proteobacteria bacterium]|nr:5-formyltetrahydrofolate cyclo-ligase [Pseudomonadota bacterium]
MNRPSDDELGGTGPCLLGELGADGYTVQDRRQAHDVALWRKSERERLIGLRMQLDPAVRTAHAAAIATQLDRLLPGVGDTMVSVYWPIRGEPDLRPWMRARAGRGIRIALPVATALGQPLSFREWRPDAPLTHGLWRIPHPAEGPDVTPAIVIAPLVGFDSGCYRLGYGGGFFDRTLARLQPRPQVIGVGYACTAIRTIFPQPHDIPMDCIVTGTLPAMRRLEKSP